MSNYKLNGYSERALKQFEDQLMQGVWDKTMTEEELDKCANQAARDSDEFKKRYGNDVIKKEGLQRYDISVLDKLFVRKES